jgi:hypothetical protein
VECYAPLVKVIWSGQVVQAAAKYGENAPTATVCCNACRTCVQTNLLGLALGAITVAGRAAVSRRFARPSRAARLYDD